MIGSRTLIQVLGIYAAGSWLVLQVVDVLTDNMGLPDWVFPFAVVLLLIGLPIILATAVVQHRTAGSGVSGGEPGTDAVGAQAGSDGPADPSPEIRRLFSSEAGSHSYFSRS